MAIDFDTIRAAWPLVDTVARYVDLTLRGTEYEGLCPFHAEKSPSFKVWKGRKGHLFTCHGCGMHGDVLDFVAAINGETVADAATRLDAGQVPAPGVTPDPIAGMRDDSADWTVIAPPPDHAPVWNPAKTWNHKSAKWVSYARAARTDAYRNAAGDILFHVARLELETGRKVTPVVSWARHIDGRECWTTVRPPAPYPFLGLEDLADRPDAPVMIVEGEKKRALLEPLLPAYVCLSVLGGTSAAGHMDLGPLRGRTVVLWPDADEAGRQMVADIGRDAKKIAASLSYIETANLDVGYDAADLVETGVSGRQVSEWITARLRPGLLVIEASAAEPAPPKRKLQAVPDVAPPESTPAPPPRPQRAVVDQTRDVVSAIRKVDPHEDIGIPAEYSDDHLSDDFARRFMTKFCFVAEWGQKWMEWNDNRWRFDNSQMVRYTIRVDICRAAAMAVSSRKDLGAKTDKIAGLLGSARTLGSVDIMSRCDRRLAATPAQFDADEWVMNTPRGLLDLRTGALRPCVPGDYCTKITRAAPGGKCPTWERTMLQACGGDRQLVGFLQRWAGYCMTGSVREEKFLFIHGEGGSGKGTFLNTLQDILGDYAITTPMETFTKRKMDAGVPADLADLAAARMVVSQENEEGKTWNEQRLKMCTGSDMIKARFMRENFFEFKPTFKLTFAGNHKPQLDNVDIAIKRRLFIIPFNQVVPVEKQDHTLKDRLLLEAEGIMQWMLEGCLEWQKIGLAPPERVTMATGEYFEDQDLIGDFIASCLDTSDKGARTALGDLYSRYLAWCNSVGEEPRNRRRFTEAMESRGIRKLGRTTLRGEGRRQAGVMAMVGATLLDQGGVRTVGAEQSDWL